jgi:TRAP-type C4-dicarboxylate transport system permease small subunit
MDISSGKMEKTDTLSKAANRISRVVVPASRVLNNLGGGLFVVLLLLVTVNVISRYVFRKPLPGGFELAELSLGLISAWVFAYCAVQKGHVIIDFVVTRLPQRAQVITGSFVGLLSMGMILLMTWEGITYIKQIFESRLKTADLGIPVYLIYVLESVGLIVFSLVLVAQFIESLAKAVRR